MRVYWFAFLAAIGTAAVLYSSGVIGSAEFGVSAAYVVLPIFFLVGLSLGLAPSQRAMAAGLFLSASPVVVNAVEISMDISRDPTSHNLFPFELLGSVALGLFPAAGLLVGLTVRKRTPVSSRIPWIAALITTGLALMSPVFSSVIRTHTEASAVTTLLKLWRAEKEYARTNPENRFTCEGPLLPGFERETWSAWTQVGLTTKDHMGSGSYWFQIRCGPLSRGDDVYIAAIPTSGGLMYCTDATGKIYSTPQRNGAVCGKQP